MSEFDGGMEIGNKIDEFHEIRERKSADAEAIINEPLEQFWDWANVSLAHLFFQKAHEQTSIGGPHLGPHCHTPGLLEMLSIKTEGIQGEY